MVDMKEINKRINNIKDNNKEAKEGYFSNNYEINDYYGLRNLMDAVKEQLNCTVLRMIYAYPDPNVSAEWSTKEIRDRYRNMIHDAEKHGLENMHISNSNKFTVDGVDFWMAIDGKKNEITIEKAIEDGPWEEVFSKNFDSTLEMLDFYMDAIDANYRMPELADIYFEDEREETFRVTFADEKVNPEYEQFFYSEDEAVAYAEEHIDLGPTVYIETVEGEEFELHNDYLDLVYARKRGYDFLEKMAEDNNEKYYEIVEDTYEYDNGLILIAYFDEEHEHEKYHHCIDLDNLEFYQDETSHEDGPEFDDDER